MTPEEEVLAQVIGWLEDLGIAYMVTGSIATSYHGRPRATHDADVVVDPTAVQLEQLLAQLTDGGFYVDPDSARLAHTQRRAFNAIEMARATKIDLIVRRSHPFNVEEFQRRRRVDLPFARGVYAVTPEDAVLSKLEWARRSGDSVRQLRDAAGVVELNPNLDRPYIEHWAEQLGVRDLWEQIRSGS